MEAIQCTPTSSPAIIIHLIEIAAPHSPGEVAASKRGRETKSISPHRQANLLNSNSGFISETENDCCIRVFC